jgi:hypothetical protein
LRVSQVLRSSAHVNVNVHIAARTSLKVSSHSVQFEVADGDTASTASIDFRAGARVPSGADVVLTIEPLRLLVDCPGGATDDETSVTFEGEGDGLVPGRLTRAVPTVTGRWQGSGLHHGRLVFTIHPAAPGSCTLPVRFVLSTP